MELLEAASFLIQVEPCNIFFTESAALYISVMSLKAGQCP